MQALGELNFRDVGGMPVAGGIVRRGLIYRSEGPASFHEPHRAELTALGVRFICDLRSAPEREAFPNDWTETARFFNADVAADLKVANNAGWSMLKANPSAQTARDAMLANYAKKPAALKPYLADIVDALIAGETPMLIHCTAGKDRTGVLVAFLLRMAGASDQAIMDDYLLSAAFAGKPGRGDLVGSRLAASFGIAIDEAVLKPIIGVEPAYLDAAFKAVDETWGSFDRYLDDLGVTADKRAALKAVLVEPARQTVSA